MTFVSSVGVETESVDSDLQQEYNLPTTDQDFHLSSFRIV